MTPANHFLSLAAFDFERMVDSSAALLADIIAAAASSLSSAFSSSPSSPSPSSPGSTPTSVARPASSPKPPSNPSSAEAAAGAAAPATPPGSSLPKPSISPLGLSSKPFVPSAACDPSSTPFDSPFGVSSANPSNPSSGDISPATGDAPVGIRAGWDTVMNGSVFPGNDRPMVLATACSRVFSRMLPRECIPSSSLMTNVLLCGPS
mmetsp:Transcript_23769/g.62142  ORF Transcript_23769/g.62142 Transcript_23769/m.62142 type:complete len:206 (-) Transcript_23769:2533-3150(-)